MTNVIPQLKNETRIYILVNEICAYNTESSFNTIKNVWDFFLISRNIAISTRVMNDIYNINYIKQGIQLVSLKYAVGFTFVSFSLYAFPYFNNAACKSYTYFWCKISLCNINTQGIVSCNILRDKICIEIANYNTQPANTKIHLIQYIVCISPPGLLYIVCLLVRVIKLGSWNKKLKSSLYFIYISVQIIVIIIIIFIIIKLVRKKRVTGVFGVFFFQNIK